MEKVYSEKTGSVANVDTKIDRYLRLLRLPDCEVNVVSLLCLPHSRSNYGARRGNGNGRGRCIAMDRVQVMVTAWS
jgi:hypothetical protein